MSRYSLAHIRYLFLIRIQAMFNIIFCYFPITFKPPSDDPYGITTEDLRLALRYATIILATPNDLL